MRLIKKRSKLTHHHFIIFGILFLLSFLSVAQSCREVIGYYPNWQWYDRAKLVNPQSIDYDKYTIINYSFFDVDINGNIQITDPWADKNLLLGPINWAVAPAGYDSGYDFGNPAYHHPGQKFSDICHSNNVKLLPSIGGFTLSSNFPAIASDPIKRQTFANSCVALIDAFGFDGIDIDWEYPGYTPHNGTAQDKVNFTLFLQAIRTAIDNYGVSHGKTMILTAAVGANHDRMDDVEWSNVSNILDAINLMSYDFFGTWDATTNHNSPLTAPSQGDPTFNLTSAVDKLINFYNVNPNKINAGVAFYGRSAKTTGTPGLHSNSNGTADLVTFSEDDGTPLYYNILKKMHLFNDNWDANAQVPYLTGKNGLNTFLSYDNEQSIGLKAQYVVDNNLRGAIIWEITGDYIETSQGSGIIAGTPLADTLNAVFCNYTSNTNSAPIITCPSTQTLLASNGINAVLPDYTNLATVQLNCSNSNNFTVTQLPAAGSSQNIGLLSLTLTVTDDCGNSSDCSFNVNISNGSNLAWSIQPANTTIACSSSTSPTITGQATATSTCGNVTVTYTDVISTGSCPSATNIVRNWTATDNCSNTIYYTQNIATVDNIAPTIVCPTSQNLVATNGVSMSIPNFSNLPLVSDNCSSFNGINLTQSPLPGTTQNIGFFTATITATDACGNTSSCSFDVHVSNGSSLSWSYQPVDAIVACDVSNLPPNTGIAIANSTCATGSVLVTFTDAITTGSCANSLRIIRTWRAEDDCGNTIYFDQSINVEDTTPPEVTCPVTQTILSSNGMDALVPDYSNLLSATDNCSNNNSLTITQVPAVGSNQNLGIHTVSFTVSDQCGNVSNCSFDCEIVSTVGINTKEKLKISLYPNPFENNFNINFNQHNTYEIIIRDAIGRLVETIQFTGQTITLFNYGSYASGTYYLQIMNSDNEVQYHKIVKK